VVLAGDASAEPLALFAVLLAGTVTLVATLATTLGIYGHRRAERAWTDASRLATTAVVSLTSFTELFERGGQSTEVRERLQGAVSTASEAVALLENTPISVLTKHPGRGAYTVEVIAQMEALGRRALDTLSGEVGPEPPPEGTERW
jgi:hypothetical protein